MERRSPVTNFWVLAALAATLVAAGCGDNGSNNNGNTPTSVPATNTAAPSTATPTVTATQTPPSTATLTATVAPSPTATTGTGAVTGLVVLSRDVDASSGDALGTPPAQFVESADAKSFDRSLAAANWSIDGQIQGVTGPDGRFSLGALTPGSHTLQISKTLDGNLASASIPFTVGDDGGADLVVEVSWGQVKSIATYTQDGAEVREVRAPSGSWMILRAGRISSFGDWGRTFIDASGDGNFEVTPCLDSTGTVPPASGEPCGADQACNPGERCVCVPSCPNCDDCVKSVCVASCPPVQITSLTVGGASQIVVGQQGSLFATAQLSDGSTFDVTYLVDWTSSDTDVATVDSWGTVTALQIGTTSVTATLGALSSDPWPLQVTARPALRKIDVQNVSCVYPLGAPTAGSALPVDAAPPERSDILPVPNCTQVVQIGSTIQFRALGEFDNNYFQDITDEVQWQVAPPEVGSAAAGLFTGLQAGTAALTASLEGVTSDPTEIQVVTQPTVIGLTIYAENSGFPVVAMGGGETPAPVASGMPCLMNAPSDASGVPCCCPGPTVDSFAPCRCAYSITVLAGDQLKFHATAQYDTGAWKDVTNEVTWESGDSSVASIDAGGVMSALQAGDAAITATLDAVTSDPANVHVVDHATLQSLWIYQEGQDRVVAKGDQRFFHAMGSYDIGISREVTTDVTWKSSDPAVGGFDTPGVFTGRAAGDVQVWAELDGVQSNQLPLEVYETSELSYCDPNNINRAVWSDDFNRVILESDCGWYEQPRVATLRYTVTEIQPHGGIFNPCLDLYVFQNETPIRTIRNEGCGDPFLAANAPGRDQEALKYQLRAFWDLKDDDGNPVPPGTYTIYGRFYLYYDPVVSLKVKVLAPNEPTPTPQLTSATSPTPTPQPTPIGEGCLFGGSPASGCGGSVQALSRDSCCTLAREGALPAAVSWCDEFDASAGKCVSCSDPCMEPSGPTPTLPPAPTAVCTPPACSPGAALVCTRGGTTTGTPGSDLGCCPDGWELYPCVFTNGQTGLACHNPALGCPSSEVCGEGCDPVVTGICDGCSDGCGFICVSGTPLPPTVTPAAVKDPAPTATPGACVPPVCGPPGICPVPICFPGEVLYCPGDCPLGCGMICVTPTPDPAVPTPRAELEVGSATGVPGDEVEVAVTLHTGGQEISSFQNDLLFDPNTPIAVTPDGVPDCTVNGTIHKEAAAFAFQPPGCAGAGCTGIRALVFSMKNFVPIPDGVVVYTCRVQISLDAPAGTYPLSPLRILGSDATSNRILMRGTDGTIVVTSDGTPRPTPTPKPTRSPTPTMFGTPGTPKIVPGSITGMPGDEISVAATLETAGALVSGIQNDITFDNANAPIAANADGSPDCTSPQSNKRVVFAFLPNRCTGGECTTVRAEVFAIAGTDLIPDGSVLYSCKVAISPVALPGTYPLTLSNLAASDPIGNGLPLLGTSGRVTVIDRASALPTATPIPRVAKGYDVRNA